MPTISTGYTPRAAFIPFHMRTERWASLVCHRRAGKTVACVADIVDAALRSKKEQPRFAYVAPFYTQAKDVAWVYLKRMVQDIPRTSINESELRVDLFNGARIRLYGADNFDRLRGIYLDGIILDEYADMDPRAWPEVIRPTLSDRKGWATFIGTPKGRNDFWRMHTFAEANPDWFAMTLKADESGLLDAEELADARLTMTPEQYSQEYLCSFDAAILGTYYGKEMEQAQANGRITSVPYDKALPVHTAWDLGFSDSTSIWFWQVAANQIRVIDYYESHGQQLPHYAAVLASKGYRYGTHNFPTDVRATVLGMHRTRVETLMDLGITPRILTDHKVMDGINAARVLFPKMWFDEGCSDGLEALRQYRTEFDEKKKTFKDNPLHDWTSHAADAFRYMAQAYRDMTPDPKPKPAKPKGIMDATFDQLMGMQRPREEFI